jgi:hypothetical protein
MMGGMSNFFSKMLPLSLRAQGVVMLLGEPRQTRRLVHNGGTFNAGRNVHKRKIRAAIEVMKAESPQIGGWKKRLRIQQEFNRKMMAAL